MTTIKLKLRPFTVPSYVSAEMPPRPKQDGLQALPQFHISELDDETLEALCTQFRSDVFAKKKAGTP